MMGTNAKSPYQQVIEKTKDLAYKSQMLVMAVEKKLRKGGKEVRVSRFRNVATSCFVGFACALIDKFVCTYPNAWQSFPLLKAIIKWSFHECCISSAVLSFSYLGSVHQVFFLLPSFTPLSLPPSIPPSSLCTPFCLFV